MVLLKNAFDIARGTFHVIRRNWVFKAIGLSILGTLAACSPNLPTFPALNKIESPATFDHSRFSSVLQRFVNQKGFVNYAGLKANQGDLNLYLSDLAKTDPNQMNESEQIAFWCNVYNAYTLKLISDNYPVRSILRITPLFVPKLNTPFVLKFVVVGGKTYTLNDVEHEILRKRYAEPRIHAAINCASVSCPPLRREAFVGNRLNEQLEDQMRIFVNDKTKNIIPASDTTIKLSKIFNWFKGDFEKKSGSLQKFLAQYVEGNAKQKLLQDGYEVSFLNYNWGLNKWNDSSVE
jgi:hypothetical protein